MDQAENPLKMLLRKRVKQLIDDGLDLNVAGRWGDYRTPLEMACQDEGGDMKTVEALLQAGASVTSGSPGSELCPLGRAVLGGNLAIVRRLLAAGADPNTAGIESGQTALFYVSEGEAANIVHALVEAGADVNHRNTWGDTPLLAIPAPTPIVTLALLRHGADANARGQYGMSALHHCLALRSADTIKHLLSYGADPEAINDFGETPRERMLRFLSPNAKILGQEVRACDAVRLCFASLV